MNDDYLRVWTQIAPGGLATSKDTTQPVDTKGEQVIDAIAILNALKHAGHDDNEKQTAARVLRDWSRLEPILVHDLGQSVSTLFDVLFPGWQQNALVQVAAALTHSAAREMAKTIHEENVMGMDTLITPVKDRAIKPFPGVST